MTTQADSQPADIPVFARLYAKYFEQAKGYLAELESQPTLRSNQHKYFHHYTSFEGMEGMVRTRSIWLSDVRYMNDSSELSYASRVIADEIQSTIGRASDKIRTALPGISADTFDYLNRENTPFVACFCEEGDLLSQWRGYGTGRVTYSLGLQFAYYMPPDTVLRKVVYGEEEQRQIVSREFAAVAAAVDALLEPEGPYTAHELSGPASDILFAALARHQVCFKHPGFAEEKEWRLIKFVSSRSEPSRRAEGKLDAQIKAEREEKSMRGEDVSDVFPTRGLEAAGPDVDVRFRATNLGLVPYVSERLAGGVFRDQLPLREARTGPTVLDPLLARDSLDLYLKLQGIIWAEVRASEIPLRSV